MENVIIVGEKAILVKTAEEKYNNKKKYEKAENAVDEDEDDLELYLLTTEIKKRNVKKKFGLRKMLNSLQGIYDVYH